MSFSHCDPVWHLPGIPPTMLTSMVPGAIKAMGVQGDPGSREIISSGYTMSPLAAACRCHLDALRRLSKIMRKGMPTSAATSPVGS